MSIRAMAQADYPYLDLTVLPEIRDHVVAANAALLFAEDLNTILWANGEGVLLIGATTMRSTLENQIMPSPLFMRQVASAVDQLQKMDEAWANIRINTGFKSRLLNIKVRRLILPQGEQAIFMTSERLHPRRHKEKDMAQVAVNCLDGYSHASAILSDNGDILAASKHFSQLAVNAQELQALSQEIMHEDDRLIKRPVQTAKGLMPAGIALLSQPQNYKMLIIADQDDTVVASSTHSLHPSAGNAIKSRHENNGDHNTKDKQDGQPPNAPLDHNGTDHDHTPPAMPIGQFSNKRNNDLNNPLNRWYFKPVKKENHDTQEQERTAEETTENQQEQRFADAQKQHTDTAQAQTEPTVLGEAENPAAARLPHTVGFIPPRDTAQKTDSPTTHNGSPDAKEHESSIQETLDNSLEKAERNTSSTPHITHETNKADTQSAIDQFFDTGPLEELHTDQKPDNDEPETHEESLDEEDNAKGPVRFVWEMNDQYQFINVSKELEKTVGSHAAQISGRSWQDVATHLQFENKDEITALLNRHDTWSNQTVLWPIDNTDLRLPVDLAGLPSYDREKKFKGFNGFGIVRIGDEMIDPNALGLRANTLWPKTTVVKQFDIDDSKQEPEVKTTKATDQENNTTEKQRVERHLTRDEKERFEEIGQALSVEHTSAEIENKQDENIKQDVSDDMEHQNDRTNKRDQPTTLQPTTLARSTPETQKQDTTINAAKKRPSFAAQIKRFIPSAFVGSRSKTSDHASQKKGQAEDTSKEDTSQIENTSINRTDQKESADKAVNKTVVENISSQRKEDHKAEENNTSTTENRIEKKPDVSYEVKTTNHIAPLPQQFSQPTSIVTQDKDEAQNSTGQNEEEKGNNNPTSHTAGPAPQKAFSKGEKTNTLAHQNATSTQTGRKDTVDTSILSNLTIPVLIYRGDNILFCNQCFFDTTGYENIDMIIEAGGLNALFRGGFHFHETATKPNASHVMLYHKNGEQLNLSPLIQRVPWDKERAMLMTLRAPHDDPPSTPDDPSAFDGTRHKEGSTPYEGSNIKGQNSTSRSTEGRFEGKNTNGPKASLHRQTLAAKTSHTTKDHEEPNNEPITQPKNIAPHTQTSNQTKVTILNVDQNLDRINQISNNMRAHKSPNKPMIVGDHAAKAYISSLPYRQEDPTKHPHKQTSPDPFGDLDTADLRSILDTATDGIIILSDDGIIRAMNRSAEALFDVDIDDVVDFSITKILAPESHRTTLDYISSIAGPGLGGILNDGREVIGKTALGGLIPIFMTLGKLEKTSGCCAVMRDITHWKKAEEELITAKAQADQANAQKSEFLAKVSHELRTPLNAIIGFSDMMIEERFGEIANDRYRSYLRDIHRSGSHVLELINDLLDISKIEAGKMELEFDACNLNTTISETVALSQPQANKQRVIIRTSLSAVVPKIVADMRSLRQILLNLVSNSIKFTKSGGQVIVSTVYEQNGEVVLRVRDTGIGMSEMEIAKALRPFQQINSKIEIKNLDNGFQQGTGLGLPLTKALVEANRASFHIESKPDEGTLVEIRFPIQRVLADR